MAKRSRSSFNNIRASARDAVKTAGSVFSNVSNASSIYNDDKLLSPRGHGFAAENANHLYDLYSGHDASIVGGNNAKNGADRIVDGVAIQSKYCASGSKCVSECFDKSSGQFRYLNPDGSPMQIEVPSDKYNDAIQAMRDRISKGQIPGVDDPSKAEEIVRKGHFTYEQARNIAKAGTVESITYDAASGAIVAACTFGLTTVLSFATSAWNGEDFDISLKNSILQGLNVGGTAFVVSVLAGQLSKAGLNSLLVGSSNAVIGFVGPKVSALLANAFRSGANIYGAAAMNSASKLLRTNVITGLVSIAVLSAGDISDIFRGRISGAQLFKNVAKTTASVAGGTGGWVAGAAAGAAIGSWIPVVGTAIGGIVGGIAGALAGGSAASVASSAVLDEFIEEDADDMIKIIEQEFISLCSDFLVTKEEAENIADTLKNEGRIDSDFLKDMFESLYDRRAFARDFLHPYFENVAKQRKFVKLPSAEEYQENLRNVLVELSETDTHL